MTLSLCLIVKDEESNIQQCIDSFKGLYDELIVVDTGSSDNTKKIALEAGAKVFDFQWKNDFSAARNFAISKANSDYIMMVDADDRIQQEDKLKLKEKFKKISKDIKGIFLPLILVSKERKTLNQSYLPKIWKWDLNLEYVQRVHEYLNIPKGMVFKKWEIPLYTDGDFEGSFERNLKIMEEAVEEEPENPRYLYYLGHDNLYSGNIKEAVKWFDRMVNLKNVDKDELCKGYINKGLAHLKDRDVENAVLSFEKATEMNKNFIEPYLYLGEIEFKRKNYPRAAKYFTSAVNCKIPMTHVFVNRALYGGIAQKRLDAVNALLKKENG